MRFFSNLADGRGGHGGASACCTPESGCYSGGRRLGAVACARIALNLTVSASISAPPGATHFMSKAVEILQFIGILLEVLLIFNLVIIVHELGHFLAARWRGAVVEEFGVWFGKPLWRKQFGGVWYSLGSIPAGGFVKLPQMAPMETLEGESDIPKEKITP